MNVHSNNVPNFTCQGFFMLLLCFPNGVDKNTKTNEINGFSINIGPTSIPGTPLSHRF